MGRRIEVVPHDSTWRDAYRAEKDRVAAVFAPILDSIHHIGSTSVPGLAAKPVIDILVVVRDDASLPDFDAGMRALRYTPRGECLDAGGTPGRFYYSRTVDGVRTHQVHVCRVGHFQIQELLRFVQYLREHDDVADAYALLKRKAARASEFDTAGYIALKHEWIRATVREALAHYGDPDVRQTASGDNHPRTK